MRTLQSSREREPAQPDAAEPTGPSAAHWRVVRDVVARAPRLLRNSVARLAAGAAILVGVGSALIAPRYQAHGLLFPQVTGPQASNFASIAARFGLGSFGGGLSLDFYSNVLESRAVLDSLLVRSYTALEDGESLLDDLDIPEGSSVERLEKGAKELRGRLTVSADEPAGLLRISMVASSPELSVELLDSLVAVANRAVAAALITQAAYQREYLERRLDEAARELAQKEATLEQFYTDNRTYQQSPSLVLRENALRREVEFARDLYGTIRQEYEQARLSEARDVPTLSFVSSPSIPHRPSAPKPLRNAVLALLGVTSIGVALRIARAPNPSSGSVPSQR